MRYAMTGATGFLGGELAGQLRSSGHALVALVRDPARATGLRDRGVELVVGDLDDIAALDQLLEHADGFFMSLAGISTDGGSTRRYVG